MPGMPSLVTPQGDDALYAAVYDELKHLAHAHLLSEADHATLNTTELVHEAFLKLAGGVPGHDITRMLGICVGTVERDWLKARFSLLKKLNARRQHEN